MRFLTWNIQAGLGVDGRVDLDRTAGVIRAMGDADVICLQEVAVHLPDGRGGRSADQVRELAARFPGFSATYGAAIDRLGDGAARVRFGNLVLSRLPVIQAFRHPLPQPADAAVKHMPRQATEVVLDTGRAPLRVLTTHLEYHSRTQRLAQARRLLELETEIRDCERAPGPAPAEGPYAPVPRPHRTVLCGDFNFGVADPEYPLLTRGCTRGDGVGFVDAWPLAHPGAEHAPTCGIHDRVQWPQGPHCRDFFFCTAQLATRITDLVVDRATDASDHQPLTLQLDG